MVAKGIMLMNVRVRKGLRLKTLRGGRLGIGKLRMKEESGESSMKVKIEIEGIESMLKEGDGMEIGGEVEAEEVEEIGVDQGGALNAGRKVILQMHVLMLVQIKDKNVLSVEKLAINRLNVQGRESLGIGEEEEGGEEEEEVEQAEGLISQGVGVRKEKEAMLGGRKLVGEEEEEMPGRRKVMMMLHGEVLQLRNSNKNGEGKEDRKKQQKLPRLRMKGGERLRRILLLDGDIDIKNYSKIKKIII